MNFASLYIRAFAFAYLAGKAREKIRIQLEAEMFFLKHLLLESDTHILISERWNSSGEREEREKNLYKNHHHRSFAENEQKKKEFFAKMRVFFSVDMETSAEPKKKPSTKLCVRESLPPTSVMSVYSA